MPNGNAITMNYKSTNSEQCCETCKYCIKIIRDEYTQLGLCNEPHGIYRDVLGIPRVSVKLWSVCSYYKPRADTENQNPENQNPENQTNQNEEIKPEPEPEQIEVVKHDEHKPVKRNRKNE